MSCAHAKKVHINTHNTWMYACNAHVHHYGPKLKLFEQEQSRNPYVLTIMPLDKLPFKIDATLYRYDHHPCLCLWDVLNFVCIAPPACGIHFVFLGL